jgi:hypothetical protein
LEKSGPYCPRWRELSLLILASFRQNSKARPRAGLFVCAADARTRIAARRNLSPQRHGRKSARRVFARDVPAIHTPLCIVMAGLVPAIHALSLRVKERTWMPGTRPGMTTFRMIRDLRSRAPPHRHDRACPRLVPAMTGLSNHARRWLWVPAFAGTTAGMMEALLVPPPLCRPPMRLQADAAFATPSPSRGSGGPPNGGGQFELTPAM